MTWAIVAGRRRIKQERRLNTGAKMGRVTQSSTRISKRVLMPALKRHKCRAPRMRASRGMALISLFRCVDLTERAIIFAA